MKFIYLTDVHITGTNPGMRKDVYYIAILKKLWELTDVIKKEKIDFVVMGGDLFEVPKVSNKLYSQVARIMRGWGVKVFIVPGNHDLYGENINTLEHTSLGALASSGVVTLMTRDKSPFYFQKKNEPGCPLVAFTGQEYYKGIDTGVNNDYEPEPSQAQINVVVAHGMLVEKPFFHNTTYTVIKDVVTSADLVLSGHYHPERYDFVHGKTRFIKPEATARQDCTQHNIDVKPEYCVVDITQQGIDVNFHEYQTAPEGKDIFDRTQIVEKKEHKSSLQVFQKTISEINTKNATNIWDILKAVTQAQGSSTKHVERATARLIQAEKAQSDNSLNGYIPNLSSVQIVKVILHNFQSHGHSEVDFDENALNALIGESNSGKTTILRAIKWVLYNDPKGTDFIKEGETSCYVTIIFNNGSSITRQRSASSAGKYEVYDSSTGKTETYTGFSHTVPIEVYNVHQMPKVTLGKDLVSLNMAEQLDGPFMLSQTAGDRAATIGKITGTQIVDEAIRQASGEITGLQRTVKEIERDIEKLDNQIKDNFADLDEREAEILAGENLIKDMDSVEDDIRDYKNLQKDIDNFNSALIKENNLYAQFANLDEISQLIDKVDLEYERKLSYESLGCDYLNNSREIAAEQSNLQSFPDFQKVNSIVDIIYSEHTHLQELKKLEYEYDINNTNLSHEKETLEKLSKVDAIKIDEIESLYYYFAQIKDLYTENEKNNKNIFSIKEDIKRHEVDAENSLKAYRDLLSTMGTCPICNSTLDKHTICGLEL